MLQEIKDRNTKINDKKMEPSSQRNGELNTTKTYANSNMITNMETRKDLCHERSKERN